eukprot:CAMPEP_0116884718 /NCGR_PEP_ID=MMETSP0463-20121206/17725_1 /TAXON_ID=181622 /ORGANISM="Strombidinopsis sp, Strain SopsisLIS2011" /LENGTH=127 /DNA_ID=CAMNT_0004541733 /DNA_START=80 /DNA_END=463 /DNA_ORIENTATION=+
MKITRTLQKQIDEKTEVISQYKQKLINLQASSDKDQKGLKDKYDFQIGELNRKQDIEYNEQQKKIKELQGKQEKLQAEQQWEQGGQLSKKVEVENEEARFKMLLRQLEEVTLQGREDLERQKLKITE